MSRIIHRFWVFGLLLALGLTAHAKVNFSLAFDKNVVAGYPGTVKVSVLVSNDEAKPVEVNNLIYSLTIPEGFTYTKNDITDGKLLQNNEVLNSGKHTTSSSGVNFKATAVAQHSREAVFTVPPASADLETRTLWTIALKYDGNLTYGPKAFKSNIARFKYLDDRKIPIDVPAEMFTVPASVDLDVKDSFNFGLAKQDNGENVKIAVQEDNTLQLNAANAALFSATLCDENGVESSTDKVKFTKAELNSEDVVANIDKETGALTLTPKTNYYGTVTVSYEVTCTALESNNVKTGSFDVTVTAVDDPTEFTITNVVAGTEGEEYTVSLAITDVDTDEETLKSTFLNGAYGVFLTINDVDYEVTSYSKDVLTQDLTVTLPYDLIAGQPRLKTATYPVKVTFKGAGKNYVSNVVDNVTFADTDQAPEEIKAPVVTISAGPYMTDTKIVIDDFIVDGNFSDADGDEIKPYYYWTKSEEEVPFATIPSTAKKGETWVPHVRVFTTPYGEDVPFKTYDGEAITIVDSPAVKVSSVDSLFIQKGEATTGSWTITFSDADIADGETYSKEAIPVPVAKKGTVTVDKVTLNQDYTYTVTYIYTVGDSSTEFTDAFEITIKSEGDAGFTVPFSVNYRTDPAPVITETTAPVQTTIAEGEATEIVVAIKAADSHTEVDPSGVASVAWTMKRNGGDESVKAELDVTEAGFSKTEGTTAATSTATVKIGFDTLDGVNRPASATYTLTAKVTDGNGASAVKTWNFTVNDTDRAPVITDATLTNSVEKDKIFTGTEVTVTAAGATDPDGDVIAYYTFNNTQSAKDYTITEKNLVKKDVKNYSLTATSAPAYKKEAFKTSESAKPFDAQITVLNSAPTANAEAKTVETSEVADDMTEVVFELANMAEFKDIDMIMVGDKLRDSLTYSVSAPSVAEAGALAVDAATGVVTYKPAKFYNGSFSFELTATDESDATAKATVNVTVKPVNDAPFIVGHDIYHVPSDCDGTARHADFTVNMGGGDDEKAQTIATAEIEVVDDGLGLWTEKPAVTFKNDDESRTISFQYTLTPETAEKLGKETIVKLKVTDATTDGTEAMESAFFEMKIVLGASPWYPTVEAKAFEPADALVADGSKAYMVEIVDATGAVAETIKIAGNDIMAADYLDYTDGLLPGEYTYKVYEWNPSEGKGKDMATATVLVDEYTTAAKPTLTVTPKSANSSELKISAPMASMYCLDITTPSNETITSWGRFMADDKRIIRSEVTLTKSFSEVGDYKVKVAGWNPKMAPMTTGEYSDVVTVTIAGEDVVADPTFPAITDAAYRPVDNKAILIANSKQAVVDFAWPSISTKAEYTLYVYTSNGQLVDNKAIATGANTIAAVTLDASQPVNHYMWRVSAKVNGKIVWSNSLAFKLVTSTKAPLVKSVSRLSDGDVLTLDYEVFSEVENVSYDVMAYDVSAGTWTKMVTVDFKKLEAAGKGELRLPEGTLSGLEDGDYIYLRVKVNKKPISVSFEDFALRAL